MDLEAGASPTKGEGKGLASLASADFIPWSTVFDEVNRRRESQRVFWFTCCLAAFAVIQAGYALTIDSLGLLSDAMHMFFHVGALGISLIGMVYARRPATFAYSYGFDRFEVLAAFSNSLFLIFVVLFVLAGALQRLLQPSVFDTDAALNLEFGIIGLLINVAGMFAIGPGGSALEHLARFQRSASGATLGGGSSGAPAAVADRGRSFVAFDGQAAAGAARAAIVHPFLGTAMSPSSASAAAAVGSGSGGVYGAGATASAAGGGGPSSGPSGVGGPNTHAIFLHFFSDGLSSLAVIVSSLLVRYRGVAAADTLQCFAVSAFTLWIVVPLFTATARILLQMVPAGLAGSLDRCRRQVSVIEGVLEVYDEHYWLQAPGCVVGSLCLRIAGDDASTTGGAGAAGGSGAGGGAGAAGGRGAREAEVLSRTQHIYAGLVQDLTVQIEVEHGSGGARHAVSHGTSGTGSSSGGGGSSSGIVNGAAAAPRGAAGCGSGHGHSHGGDSHGHSHGGHGHSHGGPAAAPAAVAPASASASLYPVGSRAAAAAIPFPPAAAAAPSSSLTPAGAAAARSAAASTAAQSALARADAWLSSAGLAPGPGVAAAAGSVRPIGAAGVAGTAGLPAAPAWALSSSKPHGGLPAVASPFAAPALTVPATAAPAASGAAADAAPPSASTDAAAPVTAAPHAGAHGHSHSHSHAHGGSAAAAAGHAAGDIHHAADSGSHHGHPHDAGSHHGHSHGGGSGHAHAEEDSHGHAHAEAGAHGHSHA